MVEVGFTPALVTNELPSTIKRFPTSCAWCQRLITDRLGSFPIRAVPIKMKCRLDDAAVPDLVSAGGLQRLGADFARVFVHAKAVFAVGIGDVRGRDAVAVGRLGVELDAIVLLRQILADQGDVNDVAESLPHFRMMASAPLHRLGNRAAQGLRQRAEGALQLEREAANETARRVGFVKVLG